MNMTMTPIHRLPRDSEVSLVESIADEKIENTPIRIALSMLILRDEGEDSTHLSITLDWAAQIRDETGFDWGTCIRYAQIAYFG